MIAKVTQYMLPNGRQVEHELDINDNCKANYDLLTSLGFRLACEMLRTTEVSQTIEHRALGIDLDITLSNGDNLDENKRKLEEMILRFDIEDANKIIKDNE